MLGAYSISTLEYDSIMNYNLYCKLLYMLFPTTNKIDTKGFIYVKPNEICAPPKYEQSGQTLLTPKSFILYLTTIFTYTSKQ